MNSLSSSLQNLSVLLQQCSEVFADLSAEIAARSSAVELIDQEYEPVKEPKQSRMNPPVTPALAGGLGGVGNGDKESDAPLVGRIRRREKKVENK